MSDAATSRTNYMVIDRFFRIKPVSLPAKDGSKRRFTLEHRIGDDGGTFTIAHLTDVTGMEAKAVKEATEARKGIHNKKTAKKVYNDILRDARNRVRGWVKAYRNHLIEFYAPQGIRPVMRFVPAKDENDATKIKKVVFIQGFYDTDSLTPVIGDIDAITLALEARNAKLKLSVDEYRENQAIAKKALALPGINKDIQNRLNQIVTGSVTPLLLDERFKGDDDEA